MNDAELIAHLRRVPGWPTVGKLAAERLTQQQQVLQWISEHGDGEARRRARAALAQGQKERE